MDYIKTKQYGGNGGSEFSDDLTAVKQILAVSIRHGSRVDSIMSVWSTTTGGQEQSEHHGGTGGSESIFVLEPGEFINKVIVRHGSEVDSLEFHTSNGKSFGPYGGTGGGSTEVDGKVGGFFGRCGSRLDAIGFFISSES